jgi:hypothetical protein
MDDKLESGNGAKTLRDRFPIFCDVCGEKISGQAPYRIVGIRAGKGDGVLVENVYQHQECAPEVRP